MGPVPLPADCDEISPGVDHCAADAVLKKEVAEEIRGEAFSDAPDVDRHPGVLQVNGAALPVQAYFPIIHQAADLVKGLPVRNVAALFADPKASWPAVW